ncbi:Serine dehydrogenase proteinase [Paenibacillus sp. NFR01]|nr:Serine dehydrogenase proteinase [Paenibacillus sp. NFR01]
MFDVIRRSYLKKLHEYTDRNVIVYYSGWLQKSELRGYNGFSLNDGDKNGFMAAIHELDKSKGLDLFIHTPGGDIAATESLVEYLRSIFGTDIRAIVPQIAMSAGTMIACSCKEIVMGKHSNLGPIDPQMSGIPTHGIIEEFNRAKEEISKDPSTIPLWQPIIAKYHPTLIGECEKAIAWSTEIVKQWLVTAMFDGDPEAIKKSEHIVSELGDHALMKSHARHISGQRAKEIGLNIQFLEDDQELQEAVLSVHHACIQTLTATPASKIIENHNGVAHIQNVNPIQVQMGPGAMNLLPGIGANFPDLPSNSEM